MRKRVSMAKARPDSVSILPSQPLRKRAVQVRAISTDDGQNIVCKLVRDMKKHDIKASDKEDKESIQDATENFVLKPFK